jgi:outer membrane protein assembly complex protein YaeT
MRIFALLLIFSLNCLAAGNYSVSLKDWPADVAAKIYKMAPELNRKDLDENMLNIILKKLDDSFNFNSLKLLRQNGSTELLLAGEISPDIRIQFENLSETTEPEALLTMGLSANNILDEDNLKSGVAKLSLFYRELGYRFAEVTYSVASEGTLTRVVSFKINKKEQTRLTQIVIEGVDPKITARIASQLQKKFRRATLTQNTLNKLATELRGHLSFNGYYLVPVPPPVISFAANELSARVLYRLTPAQRYSIEVLNSKQYSHNYLEDDILGLDTYFSKDGNMGSELAETLKAFYVLQGFPHASVPFYETKIGDRVYLKLDIDEGPFTTIKDFKVLGQYSRPEEFYKEKFFELSSAQVQDHVYIKEDIEVAAKNLLIFLQNDGYVNAKLTRVFVSTERENPSRGVLVIQLDEGPQVQIAGIKFNGVSSANLPGVVAASGLAKGQNLSLSQLELSLQKIKTFYESSGYIEYKLLNEATDLITYSENNSKLEINFNIQEGPKVEVQSIAIEGNTRTIDKIILIELDFKPGDVLTPAKMEESISRLQRTGYFNSIEITTLEKDTTVATRTVVVKVAERDPGLTVLGAGVTDENRGTLHGYFGVAYRNFFGRGVGLSLRTEANYNFASIRYLEHRHTLGFVWPYIFDSRARFRTSATRATSISDIRINKVTEANTAVFSIEQDFSSHFTGLFSYAVTTFFDHGITNDDEVQYGYRSESLVIGSIGPSIELDYRDNLFNPQKGSFSRLGLEYAADGLGNNNVDDFYRVTGQTTHYFPYKDSGFVFVQSLQGGLIKDIDEVKNEGIPFDKRGFSLGGRTTIRGFESSEFFPTTTDIGASYRLITSSSFELVKSELRFPLSVKYDLMGAFFYDGGQVRIEGLPLSYDWRDAVGFGLRYNTPVGPLNLEYGKKLVKKAGESDGAFHLSIGVF